MALNKAQLRREIQKAHREKFKLRVAELRGLITEARAAKKAAIRKDADRYLAQLLAEQEQAHRQLKRRGGAVPF